MRYLPSPIITPIATSETTAPTSPASLVTPLRVVAAKTALTRNTGIGAMLTTQ